MAENGDHQVRGYEFALIVDEHNPVSVAVIDHTDIGTDLFDKALKRLHIFGYQWIRLMIRESAVQILKDV